MNRDGERLPITDLGDCPLPVQDLDVDQEPLDLEALFAAQEARKGSAVQ